MSAADMDTTHPFNKGDEFLSLYRKVEGFTKEVLQENERLRFLVASLQQQVQEIEGRPAPPSDESLTEKVGRLEREKEELIQRYREVERENVDFARRYVEIEAENNNLANLYVASYQLHSTLDFKEVLQIVKEIIINLIGADRFAVLLHEPKTNEIGPVVTEGLEGHEVPSVRLGSGVIGQSLQQEGVYVREQLDGALDMASPVVSIPLRIKNEPLGAIVIYGLLEQKKEFTPLDIELFNLLGGHAATALFGARLYSESKRKLTTIQGFLELLKPEQGE